MINRFQQAQFMSVVFALLLSGAAQADWSLDNEASRLSFVTVKAEHVAEVHTFGSLSGSIVASGDEGEGEGSGDVNIIVELVSVNTLIPIRNERMQKMLFETDLFPEATISASVNLEALAAMSAGASISRQIEIELEMRSESAVFDADVQITRTAGGVVVSTLQPIVVMADAFDLAAGIEKLREVAGLSSISRAVPVSFTVVFNQEN